MEFLNRLFNVVLIVAVLLWVLSLDSLSTTQLLISSPVFLFIIFRGVNKIKNSEFYYK